MKLKHLAITLIATFSLFSCGEKIDRPAPILTPEQIAQSQSKVDAPIIPSGGTVSTVKHYTCPNGHPGGDTEGTCMSCGATLVHNQEYHNQPAAIGSNLPTDTNTSEPPQNSAGVWHYTCPNGHEGGGGSATPCPVCGTAFVHNTEYHDADQTAIPGAESISSTPPAAAANPEPAQNADGVWHYTCPSGHAGGAGSATTCSECGATLVHNASYH